MRMIYTISVAENIVEDKFKGFGLVGWFEEKEKAFACVRDNETDLWETCHDYVLVEEVAEGIDHPALYGERWFFKYNKEKDEYEPMDEPEWMHGYAGFSIG